MYILHKGTYHEVPYYASPIEYKKSGEPRYYRGADGKFDMHKNPYRLMLAPAEEGTPLCVPASGQREIPVGQLKKMVVAVNSYNAEEVPKRAAKRANEVLARYEEELAEFLKKAEGGVVHLKIGRAHV